MSRTVCAVSLVVGGLIWPLVATAHDHDLPRPDQRAFGAVMPCLSPDGQSMAFSYQGAIWRMGREGGEMTRLTRGRGFDVEPAWSPDGKRIAMISGTSFGSGNLAVIDARSGEPVKLPREVAAMDKLHFDQAGRRALGLFQPANEKLRLAWYDLASGELSTAVPAESWP